MKKLLSLGLIVISALILSNAVFAAVQDKAATKEAIKKYKARNFVGCISDLKMITKDDPSNVVGWYYLGSSYMNISLKPEAHEAFDKVVQLNTVPQLTSYSIQAKLCMENPARCEYQNFNLQQIEQLRANPNGFLESYMAAKANEVNPDTVEIEKLIDGDYDKIHPEAREFIDQEKLKMKQTEINVNQAYLNKDYQVAQLIDMLQNQNNDMSRMTMLMNNNGKNSNSYNEVLNYVEKSENKEDSAKMLQMMLMQNSMIGF